MRSRRDAPGTDPSPASDPPTPAAAGPGAPDSRAPDPDLPGSAVLHGWADALALAHFGRRFDGDVAWAPRLRYRAGDFTPSTGRIRLSVPYFRRYGAGEAQRILLHELCHWWLYRQGLRHREDAPDFRGLLRRVGAPDRARPLARTPRRRAHTREYACPHCGRRYRYTRRVNYACGRCCRSFGNGRYDPRFRLVPVGAPDPPRVRAR